MSIFTLCSSVQAEDQKTVFCAESISYTRTQHPQKCQEACSAYTASTCLEDETNDGWQTISAFPYTLNNDINNFWKCSCIGTKYIMRKAILPPTQQSASTSPEKFALLEKEVELLKRENALLQKDVEDLKAKLSSKPVKSTK
jgi:hypothetical protein